MPHRALSAVFRIARYLACATVLASPALARFQDANVPAPPLMLEPARPARTQFLTGDRRVFALDLTPNQFASILIDCKGQGVTATLFNPAGTAINQFETFEDGVLKSSLEIVAEAP